MRRHAVREMRRAKVARALKRATGELTEIERLMVSSERGGWKSAHRGNSLAAYSTARTVPWGGKCRKTPTYPDKSRIRGENCMPSKSNNANPLSV